MSDRCFPIPWSFIFGVGLYWIMAGYVPVRCAADQALSALPDPLTLGAALRLADEPDPAVSEAEADLEDAEAVRRSVKSRLGIRASFSGSLRWIMPDPLAPEQSKNDSSFHFNLKKRLYDFGRSRYGLSAARSEISATKWRYEDARQGRRIEIMSRFFNVLLADMAYDRDSEATSVAYTRYDRLRDRNELGQVSDIEVLKAKSEYRAARRKRSISEARQRTSRALLAEVLNRPRMLPATLVQPELPDTNRELPEVEELIREAVKKNPVLRALRFRVQSTREKLKEDRAGKNPLLTAEIERAFYKRRFGSRDRWRADMTLKVPLLTGGVVDAAFAGHIAELHRLQARLDRRTREVRQAVLETWEAIQTLRMGLVEAGDRIEYRDLYLDRSRSLYELEVKTDLGDAMTRHVAALRYKMEIEFQLALEWAKLDAMTGKPVFGMKNAAGRVAKQSFRKKQGRL